MSKPISPLSFLNNESYQIYNRHIARALGSIEAAIFLSELINRYEYHCAKNELVNDSKYGNGWFYHTIEKVEERTCLTRKLQDKAIGILVAKDLIESKAFGLPAKRHFRIKDENIFNILGFSNNLSSLPQRDKLDCTNGTNCSDPTGQTVHIYKELKEELKEECVEKNTQLSKKPKNKIKLEKIAYRPNVFLTPTEFKELLEKYGEKKLNWMLDHADMKIASNGYKYESHYHVLLPSNWVHEEYLKKNPHSSPSSSPLNENEQTLESKNKNHLLNWKNKSWEEIQKKKYVIYENGSYFQIAEMHGLRQGAKIYFSDERFETLMESEFRKWGVFNV